MVEFWVLYIYSEDLLVSSIQEAARSQIIASKLTNQSLCDLQFDFMSIVEAKYYGFSSL